MSEEKDNVYRINPEPRFDFIDDQVKADLTSIQHRRFKWKNEPERRALYFEVMNAKMRSKTPIPTPQIFVKRDTIRQYLNSYGIRMNSMIPDNVHMIVERVLNEGIARIYALPKKSQRITVYPRDLPLILF